MDRQGRIWYQFVDAFGFFAPIVAISLIVAIFVWVVFILFLPALARRSSGDVDRELAAPVVAPNPGQNVAVNDQPQGAGLARPADTIRVVTAAEPTLSWPAYVYMTALVGAVLGMLLSLVGGFGAVKTGEDTLPGAILSIVVVVLAAAATLFSGQGRIELRRPLGAISFLLSLVLCGLYWKYIRAEFCTIDCAAGH